MWWVVKLFMNMCSFIHLKVSQWTRSLLHIGIMTVCVKFVAWLNALECEILWISPIKVVFLLVHRTSDELEAQLTSPGNVWDCAYCLLWPTRTLALINLGGRSAAWDKVPHLGRLSRHTCHRTKLQPQITKGMQELIHFKVIMFAWCCISDAFCLGMC